MIYCYAYLDLQEHNATCEPCPTQIVQVDRSRVKVVGEMKNVLLTLPIDPTIHQTVDIFVANISETYGMWLSRDWSEKLKRYFFANW